MANISLESAIRTCKVDTAYANKVQSDRFLNPSLMVCPIWNGVDTTGREVCVDSYWTKNAGCNSAEDRVMVENDVTRPQYMEYINLSAQGINGAVYGNSMPYNEVGQTSRELQAINNVTGNFGLQFGANTYPGCNYYPYEEALAQEKAATKSESFIQNTRENYGRERFEESMYQQQMDMSAPMQQPMMYQNQMDMSGSCTQQPMMYQQQMDMSVPMQEPMMYQQQMDMSVPMQQPMMYQNQMDMPVHNPMDEYLKNQNMQMNMQSSVQNQMDMPMDMYMNQSFTENFNNLSQNSMYNAPSQAYAMNQENLRQQQFINQGFKGNNFAMHAGTR